MTAIYYNLELSEWEPLLEGMSIFMNISASEIEQSTVINFNAPIYLNVTESCLHNIIHTYQSWMASPDYIFAAKSVSN
jgi:hypothetical protein